MSVDFIRNSSDFQRSIRLGETVESLALEFKTRVDWQVPRGTPDREKRRRETAKEFARDVAQFANSLGGCLVIGVAELPSAGGSYFKVAGEIESVMDPQGLVQWAEEAIRNFLVPNTFARSMDPIVLPDEKIVLALNIPPSREAVALWDQDLGAIEYLTRTNHGKTPLNPDAAQRQLMNSASRYGKIVMSEVGIGNPRVELASGLWWRSGEGDGPAPLETGSFIRLGQFDDTVFELFIPAPGGIQGVKIPYSLVRDAWVVSSNEIAILLGARVVFTNARFVLEPF